MSAAAATLPAPVAALLEALPDAVALVGGDRRLVAVNERYRQTFADRRADLTGTACTDESHPAEPTPGGNPLCPVCDVLATRAAARRRCQLPDASGAMRRFEVTYGPVVDDGRITHVIEQWRDVTDRGQLEVQLSHSERLASVGLLAAGVAHEINNPLASLLAASEVLERWLGRGRFEPADVAEAQETVGLLEKQIERCREVTEKLMLLGRAYDATPGWADVNQAVRDTLALLGYEMRKHEIQPVVTLAPDLPSIWAREAAIRGICMNLMLNAVQALGHGGRLTVTTAHDPEHVTLVVADSGPGIPEEQLGRIWDPFFTTKPVGQGTGLGLSITNRIVTRHGGRIAVDSRPGEGARFTVELPIHGPGGEA